jgi:hypothetical protein
MTGYTEVTRSLRGKVRVGDNPGGTPERERAAHENHEYEVSLRQ